MTNGNFQASGDVFDGWLDDVLTGSPPVLFPIGSGDIARIEIGPGLVTLFGGAPGAGEHRRKPLKCQRKQPADICCQRVDEGGDERDRTANPRLAKPVLSQLSYVPARRAGAVRLPVTFCQATRSGRKKQLPAR
jgi:hypothetical protein